MNSCIYPLSFSLMGGDLRQARLAEILLSRGHQVALIGMDRLIGARSWEERPHAQDADCVILPLPMKNGNLLNAPFSKEKFDFSELLDLLKPNQIVLGGMAEKAMCDDMYARGLRFYDYFAREELAVLNAVPTAEGAIAIAMEETSFTIHDSRCLITGFGRVGVALARRLAALGAHVTVAARSQVAIARAKEAGHNTIVMEHVEDVLKDIQIIFNTVPETILGGERLALISKDTLIIDLASKPGGLDFQAAAAIGLKVIWALSLPGKVAPSTSGEIIFDTIKNTLGELGVMI